MRLRSQNEHRITETEEAVFLFHGHLVGMHGLVVAIQCGNEHDQGALRQVEVGDQAEFGGLLGYAPIMPVNPFGCDDFVTRTGRIPAPIHSFKN